MPTENATPEREVGQHRRALCFEVVPEATHGALITLSRCLVAKSEALTDLALAPTVNSDAHHKFSIVTNDVGQHVTDGYHLMIWVEPGG